MRLATKGLILVAIPVVAEVISVATLAGLLEHVEKQRAKAAHSAELVSNMTKLQMLATDRNVALLTNHLTGTKEDRGVVEGLQQDCKNVIRNIDVLVAEFPEEQAHWRVIKALSGKVNESIVEAGLLHKNGEPEQAKLVMVQGQNAFIQASRHIEKLTTQERENQRSVLASEEESYRMIKFALEASVFSSIFLALGLLLYFNKTTARRLDLLMANAAAIAGGANPPQKLKGRDELASLDKRYRDMYYSMTAMRERERDILEQSAEGICSFDENFRINDFNKSFASSILNTVVGDLNGERLSNYLDAEAVGLLRNACESARDSRAIVRVEISSRVKNGQETVLLWSLRWSERTGLFNCIVQDITQRVNLDRLKAEFVAMVSHDLRSPLTAVQLTHDFLSCENLSNEGSKALIESTESIKRLLALVNNLLDLDRFESQSMRINQEDRDVSEVCYSAVSAARMLAEQARISIKVEVEEGLHAYYDFERVMQVLFNLLSNAFKFSEGDTVVVVRAYGADSVAVIEVEDQGRGIPEDMLEAVFEKFRQVDPSIDNKKQKGSGLGLAICKAVIERHGGEIKALRAPGSGTLIRFTLPQRMRN